MCDLSEASCRWIRKLCLFWIELFPPAERRGGKLQSDKLPRSGPDRESLRQKGQFWTPDWVAEAMVAYVVGDDCDHLFDPAVGRGAFFRAARKIEKVRRLRLNLFGTEIDPMALQRSLERGLTQRDVANIKVSDFVLDPPHRSFGAIVANPPYIRHHRLTKAVKAKLRTISGTLLGRPLDGRAGLHVYFLIRALQILEPGGRLAFIMPADTCEGVFANALWDWIAANYRLEAVVTFSPEASPFPGVDVNPVILMIKNSDPKEDFLWAKCLRPESEELKQWALSGLTKRTRDTLKVCRRELEEGIATGLSRAPLENRQIGGRLGDYATVMRGIATGANEFFFLTEHKAKALGIPAEFLVPAIARTRDVSGDEIAPATIAVLAKKGRPTLLFCPDGRAWCDFPEPVREYLKHGERLGINTRALIRTRRPWYRMEVRIPPPILFAYLGRRNVRFIRNRAGVVPLTGFLCLYPRCQDDDFADRVWQVLRDPESIANLRLVSKSYGAGAIKVEPRALERLPLPREVLSKAGLSIKSRLRQSSMFNDRQS